MDDAIETHRQLLVDAIEVCRLLPDQIRTFAATVSALPQAMTKLRLTQIQTAVMLGERYLRLQHGGKGSIFVQAGHGMLSILWVEFDLLKGQEVLIGSSGGVFFKPRVVLDKVKELLSWVDRGELVQAVDWLSRYSEIKIDGLNLPNWHVSHEIKNDNKLSVIAENDTRHVPILGEPPVYIVSLMGRQPKSVGDIKQCLNEFSRFLVSTGVYLRRLLTKMLIIRSLASRVFNLLKRMTP
jgi:hypothetical protein